jgi:hypothetical protein
VSRAFGSSTGGGAIVGCISRGNVSSQLELNGDGSVVSGCKFHGLGSASVNGDFNVVVGNYSWGITDTGSGNVVADNS